MTAKGFDQAGFAKFFEVMVHGFGDAVGIKRQQIASTEGGLAYRALPSLEDAEDGRSGFQAIDGAVATQEQRAEMTAVDVAQETGGIVIISEKQGSEGAIGCVVAKQPIYLLQQALRLLQCEGELTAKIRL